MTVPCDALAKALAAAQAEMKAAEKSADNPHFNAKFADRGEIIEASRVLAKHGIALTQDPLDLEGRIGLTTTLMHESGQFKASTFSMKPTQDTPQADGSCLTYMVRYTAAAVCGMAISDASDDDGNAAGGTTKDAAPKEAAGRKSTRKPSTNGKKSDPTIIDNQAAEKRRDEANQMIAAYTRKMPPAAMPAHIESIEMQFREHVITAQDASEHTIRARLKQGDLEGAEASFAKAVGNGVIRAERSNVIYAAIEAARAESKRPAEVPA
jgi:hypothetical protein